MPASVSLCMAFSLHFCIYGFRFLAEVLLDNVGTVNPRPQHLHLITFNVSTLNIYSIS